MTTVTGSSAPAAAGPVTAVSVLRMSARHTIPVAALGIALVLGGCAGSPSLEPDPTPTGPPEPTSTETSDAAVVFTQPTTCAEALPAERIAEIEQNGLILLGGPGGRYGTAYAADPSPEEQAGGVTCIWGFGDTEVSSVTVSIAPLAPATRADVVESLTDQGLNEGLDGDASVFWQEGDEDFEPAVYTALRADSWISVIETVGGPDAYDEAVEIAEEAFEATHSPVP